MGPNPTALILRGDFRAAAATLTMIETQDPKARPILKRLYPHTGHAHIVGVTGAPGVGKSTLISGMTGELRKRKKTVGILSVDPSSPFTGGAILGDRVRMLQHSGDKGVFIRSMATHGGSGGVCGAVRDAVHLLDAMRRDVIFIETIGVGQDELDVSILAHTVVVVLNPSSGDAIQWMKAGLFEIADILVVNKTDLPGAEGMFQGLQGLFEDSAVAVFKTLAKDSDGISSLIDGLDKHRTAVLSDDSHAARQLHLCREQLLSLVREKIRSRLEKRMDPAVIDSLTERVAARTLDPYTAADQILKQAGLHEL
jgi:LAO/AO transport system kinase